MKQDRREPLHGGERSAIRGIDSRSFNPKNRRASNKKRELVASGGEMTCEEKRNNTGKSGKAGRDH